MLWRWLLMMGYGTTLGIEDIATPNGAATAAVAPVELAAAPSIFERSSQIRLRTVRGGPFVTLDAASCRRFHNTRKYHPACMSRPAVLYPLLVTGLGGSGTHDLASRLRAEGCRIMHEEIQTDGSVSWFYAVNDVEAHTQYPHHAQLTNPTSTSPRFLHVYHLVRCPMQQISSFTTHLNASYDFIRKHVLYQINKPAAMKTGLSSSTSKRSTRKGRGRDHAVDDVGYSNESSVWAVRNLRQFFRERTWQIENLGKGCPRGGRCWLHFAALSWLFWNSHIQRYSDSTFRVEQDVPELLKQAHKAIDGPTTASYPSRMMHAHSSSSFWFLYGGVFDRRKERVSSKKHKLHQEYSWSDVAAVDAQLAHEIHILSRVLGYSHSQRAANLSRLQAEEIMNARHLSPPYECEA